MSSISSDNEILEEEVYNIYRIEYMPGSNWEPGVKRMIWIVELGDNEAKRSLYAGDPLVEDFRRYMEYIEKYQNKTIRLASEGKLGFENHFEPSHYYKFLHECEVWNWGKKKSDTNADNRNNFDIAFFTKDAQGNDKICRYQFMNGAMDQQVIKQFEAFFSIKEDPFSEPVTLNKEMMERSMRLFPGNYIQ